MNTAARSAPRRTDALSRKRIVDAAVELLDEAGENGLTFRKLAAHLTTGPGALYHHVANKGELLVAATDAVLGEVVGADATDATPEAVVRSVALAVFDAVDAHPWVGAQLSLAPDRPPMLRIFERLGRQVLALGVPVADGFATVSALTNYMIGVAGQNAANARFAPSDTTRTGFLADVADAWERVDPDEFSFTRAIASQLREHDDREQYLAGVDLILGGIRGRSADARES